jgi:MerR family transcriptional regulator, light-induced transcriptional regulator
MTTDDELGPGSPPQPMLTVAAVARRLGVAPSTLRTWDRRYGLGPSAHTAGSHRRYSASDLGRLVTMRGLTVEGVPPAEAAQIALTRPAPRSTVLSPIRASAPPAGAPSDVAAAVQPRPTGPMVGSSAAGDDRAWGGHTVPVAGIPVAREGELLRPDLVDLDRQLDRQFGRHLPLGPGHDLDLALDLDLPGPVMPVARQVPPDPCPLLPSSTRSGGGRVMSLPDSSPQARGLARAAMSLDTPEVSRLLVEALSAEGVVSTWDTMAQPVLEAIGERWRLTGDGIDVEHAFSEAVAGVLRGLAGAAQRPRNTCPVLLSCAEGDYHSLPLHVLAAALAEQAVGCRMLGAGMPADALVAAVRRIGPAVVFVYARLPVVCPDVLKELPRQRPAPRVVIGGSGWAGIEPPAPVVRAATLAAAVNEVLAAVHI